MNRLTMATIIILSAALTSGCSQWHIPKLESWVKSYERSALGSGAMQKQANPISGRFLQQIRNQSEGAQYRAIDTGDGCAC